MSNLDIPISKERAVYMGIAGDQTVPEERRAELTERMLTLLRQGGMMRLETLHLYGRSILLHWPPKLDEHSAISLFYNYFEDAVWGTVSYDTKTGLLEVDKVGTGQFSKVVCAARILPELYAGNSGLATRNGQQFDVQESIGWLHYLFGKIHPNASVKPVTTAAFLQCSNDDCAAFWRPDGDVTFSQEMEAWLQWLREIFGKMIAAQKPLLAKQAFLQMLVRSLSNASRPYGAVDVPGELFFEFAANTQRPPVQASIHLLDELIAQYREDAALGTKQLKRYLAVLGNPTLRERVFGF